jgi:tRNA G37 N-methylase Trm5
MTKKLEIDYETADRITLLSLKYHQSYIKKELKAHKKGKYMHHEDVCYNMTLIEALNKVIKYYGS